MSDRFDELVPWYVNGSISNNDRVWVDAYLAEHPEARAEIDWYRSLSARLQESVPAVPATLGLPKVMALVRGNQPSFAERFQAFFGALGMRPAPALAGLAVIAVQGGFILNLLNAPRDDAVEMRASRAVATDDRPMVKLNFSPDAKEAQIRHLLVSVQGRLAGGPGQLGDYFVVVPTGKEAAVAEQLKTNPIVQAVSLAPGLPPRE